MSSGQTRQVNVTINGSQLTQNVTDLVFTIQDSTQDYAIVPVRLNLNINPSPEIRGDVNRNGILDTGDVTLILRYLVELPTPSKYLPILSIGDMNCNGIIDTGDATLVLRDIVGLEIPRCWE